MESFVQIISPLLLRHIPELVAWLSGIVLAVLMVRRGGCKTEKLLLAGCCLMFVASLASPFVSYLNIAQPRWWVKWVTLPIGILGLAGLVCLVWAFWVRFRAQRQVSA